MGHRRHHRRWLEPTGDNDVNFGTWFLRRGRIDRRTYWLHYALPLIAVGLLVQLVVLLTAGPATDPATGSPTGLSLTGSLVSLLVSLALIVPSVSAQVCRLHDRDHSAWWLLWGLLPLAGAIVLLVQMCLPGTPGVNRYGPSPHRTSPDGGPYGGPQAPAPPWDQSVDRR